MEYANNKITKEWMMEKYNEFNKLYFDSYLNPMYNFIVSNKKSFLGQFSNRRWSIEISTYCYRSENAFINTMLHEMCHAYVRQKYGSFAKSHGKEWKTIANYITNITNGKYGIIQRCGGADSERPETDKKSSKYVGVSRFMIFTDCYGFHSIIKVSSEAIIEKYCYSNVVKHNEEIYIIETTIPKFVRLPFRRGNRWNELRQFNMSIDDVFNYPTTKVIRHFIMQKLSVA